ncbi:MAG: thioredoxin-disulfide reductase [Oscillospiraceae bacterium]
MEHIYDMLIIGGGPGGYTAALYAARAGYDVAVLERMAPGGQMALTGEIDNYPGFDEGINGFELGMKMQKGAERFGAKTMFTEVKAVRLSGRVKTVEAAAGTFLGRTVVISTGADPRRLEVTGEAELLGRGVHYCAHCDGRFYKGKTVAVVGGGNSAAADALYLSKLAEKVYLVHRRDTLRATKIYHEPLFRAENVEFIWNSSVSGFVTDGKLTGVQITNLNTGAAAALPCDGVFVSIGRIPATGLLAGQVALNEGGYVIADESTRTDVAGVFAVGDIRTKALRQVVTAVADGANAAHFAGEYISEK